jgi:hypothetical protein
MQKRSVAWCNAFDCDEWLVVWRETGPFMFRSSHPHSKEGLNMAAKKKAKAKKAKVKKAKAKKKKK